MNLWPFKSSVKPVVDQPWVYQNYLYVGVENGNHVYIVTYAKGSQLKEKIFRFHAAGPDHGKPEDVLERFFAAATSEIQ